MSYKVQIKCKSYTLGSTSNSTQVLRWEVVPLFQWNMKRCSRIAKRRRKCKQRSVFTERRFNKTSITEMPTVRHPFISKYNFCFFSSIPRTNSCEWLKIAADRQNKRGIKRNNSKFSELTVTGWSDTFCITTDLTTRWLMATSPKSVAVWPLFEMTTTSGRTTGQCTLRYNVLWTLQ